MGDVMDKEEPVPDLIRVLRMLTEGYVEGLVEVLGESPEAWRGAAALHDVLRSSVTRVLDAYEPASEADAKSQASVVAGVAMTVLMDFNSHPMAQAWVASMGDE